MTTAELKARKLISERTTEQLVDEVISRGYIKFRIINTMKCFADAI